MEFLSEVLKFEFDWASEQVVPFGDSHANIIQSIPVASIDTIYTDTRSENISCKTKTTDDEDKKIRKRRERNKIAATKCRNKKREEYNRLLGQSEYLEQSNTKLR